jgi:hypothetical protein
MRRFLLFLFELFTIYSFAQTNFNWKKDLEIPYVDANGNRLTGTEVIHLVNHKGKLYAGNSYWNETVETRRRQVWVKDCTTCNWKRDYQIPIKNSRVPSLFSVAFRTNWQGNVINPNTILPAGSTHNKGLQCGAHARVCDGQLDYEKSGVPHSRAVSGAGLGVGSISKGRIVRNASRKTGGNQCEDKGVMLFFTS